MLKIVKAIREPRLQGSDTGPVLLNGDGDAEGMLWKRMCHWMFDVGVRSFPWQLTWREQPAQVKIEFWKKCRAKFPEAWSERMVGAQVLQCGKLGPPTTVVSVLHKFNFGSLFNFLNVMHMVELGWK